LFVCLFVCLFLFLCLFVCLFFVCLFVFCLFVLFICLFVWVFCLFVCLLIVKLFTLLTPLILLYFYLILIWKYTIFNNNNNNNLEAYDLRWMCFLLSSCNVNDISLETFVVTEFNKIFSGQTAASGFEDFPQIRELTPETSENLHILARLSAPRKFHLMLTIVYNLNSLWMFMS
jgi:nuclear pore complex protein Nup62